MNALRRPGSISDLLSSANTRFQSFNLRTGFLTVVWVFVLSRFIFYVCAISAVWLLPESDFDAVREVNARYAVAMHWRWDAVHYYTLALDGYVEGGTVAFFPLLSLLIHVVAFVFAGLRTPAQLPIHDAELSTLLAGIVVANVVFFFALWLLYLLAWQQLDDPRIAERAILYTAVFPMALFYSVPYSEGLFLLASVAVFLMIRRQSWVLAGCAVAIASLARPVGVALIFVLVLEVYLAWRGGRLPRARWANAIAGLLIAPTGIVMFMAHLWRQVGDPLAFNRIHFDVWGHERIPPPVTIARGISYLIRPELSGAPDVYMRGLLNAMFLFAFIGILVLSLRIWQPSYVLYGVLLMGITLSNPFVDQWVLHGQARFLMVLFPVYFTLAIWGSRPRVHVAILAVCLPLFGILTAMYVNWYPVA